MGDNKSKCNISGNTSKAKGNEEVFAEGKTIVTDGSIHKGDGFYVKTTYKGAVENPEKGSVFTGDGYVAHTKFEDTPINPNTGNKLSGDGYVNIKESRGQPKDQNKPAKTAKNIQVSLPDGREVEINLPEGKNKLIDLKNQIKVEKLVDNVENCIFKRKDKGELFEILNDQTLYSWDDIFVTLK